MTRRFHQAAAATLGAALLVTTVGCSDSDGTATGSTQQPAEAQAAFCDDVASYVAVLDPYGRIFTEPEATVGQLETDAQGIEAARVRVERSANQLADAITAANTAATAVPGTEGTTTTVLASMSADEHVKAISQAEKELDRTLEGVETGTPVSEASAEVQAAAFGLEQAYVAVFVDAGCLADDAAAAKAVQEYSAGLQTDLTTLGFYTEAVDGVYGPATVTAVKAFQAQSGLKESGVVDPQTEAAMAEQLRQKGSQQALNIAALEGALTAAGFYSGPIDGAWTPAVEDALIAFQTDRNLPPTGAIDPATLAALLELGASTPAPPATSSTTTTSTQPSATSTTTAGG